MSNSIPTLEDLNTRDKLLLAQLIEELKIENIQAIHGAFINHPAFSLSHNSLHDTDLTITESDLERIATELIDQHKDLSLIGICEHYYTLRKQEILQEMETNKEAFAKVREKAHNQN
ncbi:hypothetical protein WICPIJ_003036 [Wickerhamomyces pijperi]|uniref:Uncharacterized protein n=1 Tax=Wickerhamomyces pijperi TaxID=599730 RepID=A0A9P8Q8R1_WICPI|nr:hypothetical protein WICPIJ_003036 [Wickerhamomyces pijperi]